MSPGSRLLWGSLVGALIMLLFHPASSPFYRLFLRQLGPSHVLTTSPHLLGNVKKVSTPKDKRSAAFFLLIASREVTFPRRLTQGQAQFAASLASSMGDSDSENAFWRQMAAVFDRAAGQNRNSAYQWQVSANASRWDDGQNQRLLALSLQLQDEFGADLSWQKAVLSRERGEAHAVAIAAVSRALRPVDLNDTEMRLASLFNGQLMMEGSRSISIGAYGVQIMREASLSGREIPSASYAQMLRRRQAFLNTLREHENPEAAAIAESLYRNADSWTSVVNTAGNRDDRLSRELWSAVAASLPGPFVYLAITGGILCGLAYLARFYKIVHRLFSFPVAPVMGLAAGIVVYSSTKLIWPSLWAVLSLSFFVFQPGAIRSARPVSLTGQHRILLAVVAIIFSVCVLLFVAGLGAPMRAMATLFGVPIEYQAGSSLLLGLALLMLSIIVFSAAVWAIILRFDSAVILSVALGEMGKVVLMIGLVGSVAAAPLAIWLDRSVAEPISKTLLNEPNLYLSE